MDTPKTEAHWVLLAQCHDREALENLLRSVQPSLSRYVRRLVGSEHADDITQDVLVILSQKIGWLRQADLFRPWMFRIASRAAFRHLRKERRWTEQVRDPDALEGLEAPGVPAGRELLDQLRDVEGLSPASRAVLVLHFEEGLTLSEIAAVLEVPLGTVKSRLAYGLSALRRRIDVKGGQYD